MSRTEIQHVGEPDDHDPDGARGTGRRMLMKGGIAAAVAAVAGLGSAQRASAANGDPVEVGVSRSGTATTHLQGGTTLRVTNGSSAGDASVYGTQNNAGRFGIRGANSASVGVGVYGEATGGSAGRGVSGQAGGAGGVGVYGQADNTAGIGVYGIHDSTAAGGSGVTGESKLGAGVVGRGTSYDVLANGGGRIGLTQIGQAGAATSPGGGAILARDADANLWWNYAADRWRRLAGPATAGAFHAIDPIRAYDSRVGVYTANGVMGPNTDRVILVADGHDATGAVNAANAVPAGATAVAFNVTVTGTTGPNFLSVVPGDATSFTTSTINWSDPAQSLANGSIVKLDASRRIKVFCGDQTGSVHVIIDVTGYFL